LVAKSTITLGVNNKISAIKAPTLTLRLGSPAAGFFLWQSSTLPPKIVAHPEVQSIVEIKRNTSNVEVNVFFILDNFQMIIN